ncbi:MAG: hypothetical protein ABSC19_19690, partial [Syntrophorhabdales bacterium]
MSFAHGGGDASPNNCPALGFLIYEPSVNHYNKWRRLYLTPEEALVKNNSSVSPDGTVYQLPE